MKRYCLFLLMLCCAVNNMLCQDILGGLRALSNGKNQEMSILKEALSSDLYLIRQQYRLERKGKTYGKSYKPYYGETYSLGIKVSGGMYVTNSVIEPWKGDVDYERVNADGKYKPEYFWTYQRHLNDSVYKAVELDFGTAYISAVNVDKSLWLHQDLQSDFGLSIDNSLGEKRGYVLWA